MCISIYLDPFCLSKGRKVPCSDSDGTFRLPTCNHLADLWDGNSPNRFNYGLGSENLALLLPLRSVRCAARYMYLGLLVGQVGRSGG